MQSKTISDKKDERFLKLVEKKPYLKYFKPPFVMTVIGACASGKTHFALNLLKDMKKYFDYLVVYVGTRDQNHAFEALETKKLSVRVFNEYSGAKLSDFIKSVEEEQLEREKNEEDPLRICMLFDDFSGFKGLMSKSKQTDFDKLITNYRHYNISVIICSQVYKMLSTNIRSTNMTHLILCGLSNREKKLCAEEHANEILDDKNFVDLYSTIRKEGIGNCLGVFYKQPLDKRYMWVTNGKPEEITIE